MGFFFFFLRAGTQLLKQFKLEKNYTFKKTIIPKRQISNNIILLIISSIFIKKQKMNCKAFTIVLIFPKFSFLFFFINYFMLIPSNSRWNMNKQILYYRHLTSMTVQVSLLSESSTAKWIIERIIYMLTTESVHKDQGLSKKCKQHYLHYLFLDYCHHLCFLLSWRLSHCAHWPSLSIYLGDLQGIQNPLFNLQE